MSNLLIKRIRSMHFYVLLEAIKAGDLEAVKKALGENTIEYKSDKHRKENDLTDAIFYYPEIDRTDEEGLTALMHAAKAGHASIVAFLLASGADSNLTDNEGYTVLMHAGHSKENTSVNEIILKQNPNLILKTSNSKFSPLMLAAARGNLATVQLLLKMNKENLNACDNLGFNALLYAKMYSNPEIEKLLIEAGATEPILDKDQKKQLLFEVSVLGNSEFVKALEKEGVTFGDFEGEYWRKNYLIKETGHLMGISKTMKIFKEGEEFIVSTEGHAVVASGMVFDKIMKNYKPKNEELDECLKELYACIHPTTEFLKFNGKVQEKDLLKRYLEGKLCLVPVISYGHGFSILLYKDNLVIINRGRRKLEKGITFFKIPKNKNNLITANFIRSLSNSGFPEELDELNNKIGAVVDFNSPVFHIDVKDQQHGTCSLVNIFKSPMLAMLFFIIKEKLLNNKKWLNEMGISQNAESNEILNVEAQKQAYPLYKKLTDDMVRTGWVRILLELYNNAKDKNDKEFYLDLFKTIITSHYGQEKEDKSGKRTVKIGQEFSRILLILNTLSEEDRNNLIERLTYIMFDLIKNALEHNQRELVSILSDSNYDFSGLFYYFIGTPFWVVSDFFLKLMSFPKFQEYVLKYKDNEGKTFLEMALLKKNESILMSLIKIGFDKNTKYNQNVTLLMRVAAQDFPRATELLIKEGVDVDAVDAMGRTALVYAVNEYSLDCAKMLLTPNTFFILNDEQRQKLMNQLNLYSRVSIGDFKKKWADFKLKVEDLFQQQIQAIDKQANQEKDKKDLSDKKLNSSIIFSDLSRSETSTESSEKFRDQTDTKGKSPKKSS